VRFALQHADAVGISFVSAPDDVARISERLREARRPGFGMILKLETRGAIRNSPRFSSRRSAMTRWG
jgi:pyruvate kinase